MHHSDVRTRFDSTLEMLESVLVNREVLERMQELGRRREENWPKHLYLYPDDFLTYFKCCSAFLKTSSICKQELYLTEMLE